jgi:heat shock protein HslJ
MKNLVLTALSLAAFLASTGAAQAQPPAAKHPSALANTEWRLIEIQSMDDAVGTKRPADPSKYTMALRADGTANLKLNCNSANGKWSAEPGPDSSSGKFSLGPLAMTRMMCPPPSFDAQISTQAQYIRSFLLKGGKLHLSLMADGGIFVWEPATAAAAPAMTPDPQLEAAILAASPSYTLAAVKEMGATGQARYSYERIDLNGDAKEEVFVYLLGSIFCGTGGCQSLLFRSTPDGYQLLNSFPITRLPFTVSPHRTSGWNDLYKAESGGGAPPSYLLYTSNGKKYKKGKRIPGGNAPQGKHILASEITFDKGIPLTPRK